MGAGHPQIPAGWPPFVALGIVVVLSVGAVVVDLVVDRETAARTDELVDDALRSVTLADDMRSQAHRLERARRRDRIEAILAQLAYDAREFDPLANGPSEREEWGLLRVMLAALRDRPQTQLYVGAIETSIDRIVEINRQQATNAVAAIRAAQRDGIWVDTGAGLVTLGLAAIVALWLRRAMRSERALVTAHLELVEEQRRELEAFAGRVAHDLRGPLAPVRGYADMIAETTPAARGLAMRIQRATDRMSAIIDDLLALSMSGHPGAGETAVAPVVHEVVDELDLAHAHIALELADCAARCTPSVLHQIIGNLVHNAIKYRAPDRRLELAISCTRHDGMVDVAIADNGIGMDTDTAAHVFEPFFRARSVAAVPGHGLGLAIVKRTVDALGGTCVLDSAVDRGTRVTVRLPAA
jgi:signal transduction histidine kinase